MSRWRAALPRLEKRNGLTPPSVNRQPSCPACDIFHGQNDTYPDLPVRLRRETHVRKRIAKGDSTCGQDRCLGSHGDGRKRSRLEATLRVCAVTILVSDMAKYYFEVHHPINVDEGDAELKPSAPFRGGMQKPPYTVAAPDPHFDLDQYVSSEPAQSQERGQTGQP